MKIYRGPNSEPLYEGKYNQVSEIHPDNLEAMIRGRSHIEFNINKEHSERKSRCSLKFGNEDIIPAIAGLLSRLKYQQSVLFEIFDLLGNDQLSSDEKIDKISLLESSTYYAPGIPIYDENTNSQE